MNLLITLGVIAITVVIVRVLFGAIRRSLDNEESLFDSLLQTRNAEQEAQQPTELRLVRNDPHQPQKPRAPRFTKRAALMSPAEKEFFGVLTKAVPEAPIFPKVRVADILEARKRWSGDFLTISQKHFDWILCHPTTYEPLVAIELDDSSHNSAQQRKRDSTKDSAANEAGLSIIRFPWQRSYDAEQIREAIAEKVNAL